MNIELAANPAQRYGAEHIRRSLRLFLVGKIVSALAGVAFTLLLARFLSVAEFAAYSALGGFVEMLTAFAGFGITHALLRYIPELYAQHQDIAMRHLILWGMALRTLTLLFAVGLIWVATDPVTTFFHLSEWKTIFGLFLLLTFVRVSFYFIYQILESLLAQSIGQTGFVFSNVLKLAGALTVLGIGYIDISAVIHIEVLAEAAGLGMMLVGMARLLSVRAEHSARSANDWLRENWSRIWRYGLTGYLQHLAVLLYGSSPNRLAGARFLETSGLAGLGFSQSLADALRRYLPVQFFQGVIRPVLIARYSVHGDYSAMTRQASLLLRFNLLVLAFPLVSLATAGETLIAWLTGGKYGVEANVVLILLLVALALESARFLLDIVIQAVERFDILLYTNLLLSFSLLAAIPMISRVGVAAIPLANILGLMVANLAVLIWLGRAGYRACPAWKPMLRLLTSIAIASALGRFITTSFGPWMALSVGILSYSAMLWLLHPFNRDELTQLARLRRKS